MQIESGVTIGSGTSMGDVPSPIRPARYTTAVGNAQVSTTQVKFGTGSYTNNALSGYLSVTPLTISPANTFAFGRSDFTLEFWYYPTTTVGDMTLMGFRPPGGNGPYPTLAGTNGGGILYYVNSLNRISTAANVTPPNVWTSIAIVRYSGITTLYVNGTQTGTPWTDTTAYQAGSCIIGGNEYFLGQYSMKGYMDEIRISNVARYTGNYTPATQPFTDDINTLLLLHCNGSAGSKNFPDDNS